MFRTDIYIHTLLWYSIFIAFAKICFHVYFIIDILTKTAISDYQIITNKIYL